MKLLLNIERARDDDESRPVLICSVMNDKFVQ